MLVFFQPGIQLLVELEVVETDGGFQGDEVDKLFLDGIGLQVDSVSDGGGTSKRAKHDGS